MQKQLLLFHNAVSAYFSGNQSALEATMKQFAIKVPTCLDTQVTKHVCHQGKDTILYGTVFAIKVDKHWNIFANKLGTGTYCSSGTMLAK